MASCRIKTVAAYERGTGAKMSNPAWVCCPATMIDGKRQSPHEDGYGHIAGGVENFSSKILEWEDGTITHQGKPVNKDGSPVSATGPVGETFALPEQPDMHTIVKAGSKSYVRWTDQPVNSPWREVDNPDNIYSWAQLFVKASGEPLTVAGVDAKEKVKGEVRTLLIAEGVGLPTSTSRNLINDLNAQGLISNKAINPQAKVGDRFRVGVDKFPDNVTGIRRVREDGTTSGMREWTRAENGLFRLDDYGAGFADPSANTSTRFGDDGKMKTHGSTYQVTKVKG